MAENKVAVVTGAARGIGQGIALQLAEDGFDIAVADLPTQREAAEDTVSQIEALGRKAFFRPTDVSDKDQVFGLIDDTVDTLGTFDVLVNNAGICQVVPFTEITPEQLETIYHVNIFSVVFGIQAAAAKFEELGKERGRIISASSIAGFEGFPILGAYSSTKFAVRGLTQAAAQEFAPRNITVNGYAPGIVDTPMWDYIDEEMGKLNGKPKGENMKAMKDSIALGRYEYPRDVAGVVSFLASEKADYVTGQTIIVDGGMQYR
ncbi:acetoin reductase [Alloscardovia criceti]|uniref:acetoin reductase n=1 Tax=Alloscardovia criceti TaxID=356828 RepID=UPI00037A40F2|nr:acetoin reductase [Alloscardovia criceti]